MINTLLKRRMENTKKNKKGFTLVELIVVLVIIAILAAVLIPTMSGYIKRANKTAAQSAAKTLVTAYDAAMVDYIGANPGVNDYSSVDKDALASYVTNYVKSSDDTTTSVTFDTDGAMTQLVCTSGKFTVTYDGSTYTVSE